MATVDKTRALIKGLVNIRNNEDFGVSFPLQKVAVEADRFPPLYHMLISGLMQQQAEYLANLEIVSTKEAKIIFRAFENPRPSFALTIHGLTFTNSVGAPPKVTNIA
ncbi:hypothetical protein C0992_000929 [Termitomyces sp. T32_za158]|nr:hypothetical protein C0992_000929 [Termitomyces sp. T32_za158]